MWLSNDPLNHKHYSFENLLIPPINSPLTLISACTLCPTNCFILSVDPSRCMAFCLRNWWCSYSKRKITFSIHLCTFIALGRCSCHVCWYRFDEGPESRCSFISLLRCIIRFGSRPRDAHCNLAHCNWYKLGKLHLLFVSVPSTIHHIVSIPLNKRSSITSVPFKYGHIKYLPNTELSKCLDNVHANTSLKWNIGALEIVGEDLSEILPAIDDVSWQMI
jgi:hypothetical protein